MVIQALLFDNAKWTPAKARSWMKRKGYKPIKRVDKTDTYLRYRLRQPQKKSRYRTIKFGKGIKAVLQY